jgi:hypothetical protein
MGVKKTVERGFEGEMSRNTAGEAQAPGDV